MQRPCIECRPWHYNGQIHDQVQIHFEEVVNLFATKHPRRLKLATIHELGGGGGGIYSPYSYPANNCKSDSAVYMFVIYHFTW